MGLVDSIKSAFSFLSSRTQSEERVAQYVAQQVAKEIAQVPADAAPPAPATLNVLLRESPVAWASYEVSLLGSAQ